MRTATCWCRSGDFWLQDSGWNRFAPEYAGAMSTAVHAAMPVVVIDGNHEVWPCLSEFAQRDDTAAARRAGRPLHLGGSLWWADRGSTWTWAGRRFGALGGSASPDRWIPAVANKRWDQETTTQQDLQRLLDNAADGLDVLVCHDAPEGTTGLVSGLPWEMPPPIQHAADTLAGAAAGRRSIWGSSPRWCRQSMSTGGEKQRYGQGSVGRSRSCRGSQRSEVAP